MANGMAGLFVGASGLKTAQTALNTTAHNLSNINTTGYTRQQVTLSLLLTLTYVVSEKVTCCLVYPVVLILDRLCAVVLSAV